MSSNEPQYWALTNYTKTPQSFSPTPTKLQPITDQSANSWNFAFTLLDFAISRDIRKMASW